MKRLRDCCCRFAIKPKPQIQFAVWKGRNGLRGKEAPQIAGTRSVEAGSDAPPAAISFPSRGKRYGRKGRLRMRLVLPASAFRQDPMFRASFHSRLTLRVSAARRLIRGAKFAASCLRVYLKTPNAPGQRTFSRCAAPFFLEIRQYSCEKMSCSAQKFLAAGHIGSFQIHPRLPVSVQRSDRCFAAAAAGATGTAQ